MQNGSANIRYWGVTDGIDPKSMLSHDVQVAGVVKRPSAQDNGHISPSASAGVSPRGALQPAGAPAHVVGSGMA